MSSFSRLNWRVTMPSAVLSTLFILLLDVFAICLLRHSLKQVAAYLTARPVYDNKKPVCISEKWIETFTGHTYGPMWFRWTQTVLTCLVLVMSVLESLSLNGGAEPVKVQIPGQTILVQKPRTLSTLGLGTGRDNYSQELLFSMQYSNCKMDDSAATEYVNYRHLLPLNSTFTRFYSLPIECLHEVNGLEQRSLFNVSRSTIRSSCSIEVSSLNSIIEGTGKLIATDCNVTSMSSKCIGHPNAACAAFVNEGNREWLFIVSFYNRTTPQKLDRFPLLPTLKNNETLTVIAMFAAHLRIAHPELLQLAAAFQASRNNTVIALRGQRSFTEIDVKLFLPSILLVIVAVLASTLFGLSAMCVMHRKGRARYNFGFTAAEVAKLATTQHTREPASGPWYLKQHPGDPILTVSTNSLNIGRWCEDEVRDKKRHRE